MSVFFWVLIGIAMAAALATFGAFVYWLFCDGDTAVAVTVMFVALVVGLVTSVGAGHIKTRCTTVEAKVVSMEVTKTEVSDDEYVIVLDNKHDIKVSEIEYSAVKVGDVVDVEVTDITVFDETSQVFGLLGVRAS